MTASGRQWEQSLYSGAPGIALLHITNAHVGRGGWDTVHEWVTAMVRHEVNADPTVCSLFEGAPAVAFALHIADRPAYAPALASLDVHIANVTRQRLQAAHKRIDRGELPRLREFDIISGLTGLGAYHLARQQPLVRDVVSYLVRLTAPLRSRGELLPGWWSGDGPELHPSPTWPGGHGNFGLAHGITGPLAFLATCMRRGVTVPGHADAIRYICAALDQWRHGDGEGAWWPETISRDEWKARTVHRHGPGRPSWCYGTPGIARTQQLAALTLGDEPRQRTAEAALAACVTDEQQLAQLTDASLCHGWAGLIRTLQRAAHDAGPDSALAGALPMLRARMRDHLNRAGPPASVGLMEGTEGVHLAQLDTAVNAMPTPHWDACLLLDG
ncbi:lanthionine synthetase C family protein [Streptomyces sp. NPDC002133]|uniref:lanthionine synthetase C family protein n=1 Tax=Streptomyces sp. NPDC002133 TaxID=3154409 RepID=UPI00331F978E